MKTYRILHADDEEGIREIVKTMIRVSAANKSYKVEYVGVPSAEEFYQRYGERFDVSITDNNMERENAGLDALVRLADEGKLQGINYLHCTPLDHAQREAIQRMRVLHTLKGRESSLVSSIVALLGAAHEDF